jgi:predicted RNA methylase
VAPIPPWLDAERLLGPGDWQLDTSGGAIVASAELDPRGAADLEARLRGVALAGQRVICDVQPKLARPFVCEVCVNEARRMRNRSAGFSRAGTVLDDEMRLGLTPERLAHRIGERAKSFLGQRTPKQLTVVDACCGAGGNAIGFARSGLDVVAIELDPRRLAAAEHNAKVYGVSQRIRFIAGDARDYVANERAGLWFLDVPWAVRDEKGQLPLLAELLERLDASQPVWAKVPSDFDPALVPGTRPSAWFGASDGDERRVKLVLLERP